MRVGAADADAYMEGWRRTEWAAAEGAPGEVADRVAAELEAGLDEAAMTALLDALGPGEGA